MGRGIVQLFQVFSFLFILLSGGLVYWQIVRSPALQVVPENPRLVEEEARIVRGEVLDRQGKPLVECAVYELEIQITSIVPGRTPCLACLHPENPPAWKREFPIFGAVAGTAGCLGAMEAIKLIAGLGQPLLGQMLSLDHRDMTFRKRGIARRPDCAICAGV